MILALIASLGLMPQESPISWRDTRSYLCYKAAGQIVIDGKLDDEGWKGLPWTEEFLDIEGRSRPAPRYRTRARMAWDDTYFYICAEMEEPHVWGTLVEHDSVIFHDNDFEVFLDPDGDHHNYDEYEINALGTDWDLRLDKPYRDGGPARNEREIEGLKAAVHVDGTRNNPADVDRGWSVEIAIPFAALKPGNATALPPNDGDVWRVNFSRVEWMHEVVDGHYKKVAGLREDNWVWSPQGAIDMHRPERWGRVQFTSAKLGQGVMKPDEEGPARDLLVEVYKAQKAFRESKGRWAESLAELSLEGLAEKLGLSASIQVTGESYRARVKLVDSKGSLSIGPDSRLER